MNRGKIIVIEGTDGSGKETQSKRLYEYLNNKGLKVKSFSFPIYNSPTGRIVGGPYLGKKEINDSYFEETSALVDPLVSSLYYAADRRYNLDIINDYLEKGYYVVLDRYVSSNMAHQGAKIDDPDLRFELFGWIDKLEYWLLELPKPDKTIFLHVPYKYTKELIKNRESLDDNEKDENYQINSIKTYLELADLYHWNMIDCIKDDKLRSIEDINKEILDIILDK